jgi:tRNA threonylcarbamoyladenosine biosynthesis protein TsaE
VNVTELSVVTRSPDETRGVGRALGAVMSAGDLVLLSGELGVGKTQLAKGIAEALGIEEPVVSPSFTITRSYRGRVRLMHVDVYRLDRVQELLDLGLEEDADESVTVVEWGDVAAAHLSGERLDVRLERLAPDGGDAADDQRVLTLTTHGPSWAARATELERALHGML